MSQAKYEAPEWDAAPSPEYPMSLEVMKNGIIIDKIDINKKSYFLFGRQPDVCDISLQHPTISRQHAVIQHKGNGLYILIIIN